MAGTFHVNEVPLTGGSPLDDASVLLVFLHGRGSTPEEIIGLAQELPVDRAAWIAPRASGRTWYPHSFLQPISANEPYLSDALQAVHNMIERAVLAGIPQQRIAVVGFSQGACLALEAVARRGSPVGAVIGFSGGLIGPAGTPRDYAGRFEGMRVFLGCSDVDPHVPAWRVRETADVFSALGAHVDMRIYRSMGHVINDDELAAARGILQGL